MLQSFIFPEYVLNLFGRQLFAVVSFTQVLPVGVSIQQPVCSAAWTVGIESSASVSVVPENMNAVLIVNEITRAIVKTAINFSASWFLFFIFDILG